MTKFEFNVSHAQLSVILLFILGCIYSTLIPPFQSPDEFDHIKRAYALSQGRIEMETLQDQSSGVMVDGGLNAYMAIFNKLPFKYESKLTSGDISAAENIGWSENESFSPAPGVSYYFPIIYLPHATGLGIGQLFNLSVNTSYYLARFLSLLTACALLLIAFQIYRPNLSILTLLFIPMTLFQFSSPSLDGMATALCVLVLSLFMRAATQSTNIAAKDFIFLTACTTVLIMCRINLLPVCLILFFLAYSNRNKNFLYLSTGALGLILLWLAYAVSTTVDKRVVIGTSSVEIMAFYITHPIATLQVLFNTITDGEKLRFYINSFFGVLGWLDHSLPRIYLNIIAATTAMILIISCQTKALRNNIPIRALLIFISLCSFLMIFLLLLFTWNKHPASIIEGVQGRYFLIPVLIFAYALSNGSSNQSTIKNMVLGTAFLLIVIISIFVVPKILLERYFVGNGFTNVYAPLNISDKNGLCALDSPANHAQVKSSEAITMNGWAFDPSSNQIPATVYIHLLHIDSGLTTVIPAGRSSERPDVAKAFNNPLAVKSGFVAHTIAAGTLATGGYEASIVQQHEHSLVPCQVKNIFEVIRNE